MFNKLKITIMKKMYKQPHVEATEVLLNQNLLAGSAEPGTIQNSNQGTGDLGGGEVIGG